MHLLETVFADTHVQREHPIELDNFLLHTTVSYFKDKVIGKGLFLGLVKKGWKINGGC